MKGFFRDLLYHPGTKTLYTEGDIVKREMLAITLERLANAADPVELFYRGEMAKEIAKEFEENSRLLHVLCLRFHRRSHRSRKLGSVLDFGS